MTQQVRVRINDWVKRKNQITRSYLYMLLYARQEILIMCSYFLPGRMFRREILNAVKRGVAIKVVLAGPSDVMVAKHAERYLYNWLLRNKISVYEYQKTVLHAKMAVADASFVTVGSYNINNISAYASLELNMDVKDPLLAAEAKQRIEQIIVQDCREVTRENFPVSRNIFRRWWEWLCYRFINTMLSLFTFYFKQEE
jgi:cardiolipin synthase